MKWNFVPRGCYSERSNGFYGIIPSEGRDLKYKAREQDALAMSKTHRFSPLCMRKELWEPAYSKFVNIDIIIRIPWKFWEKQMTEYNEIRYERRQIRIEKSKLP